MLALNICIGLHLELSEVPMSNQRLSRVSSGFNLALVVRTGSNATLLDSLVSFEHFAHLLYAYPQAVSQCNAPSSVGALELTHFTGYFKQEKYSETDLLILVEEEPEGPLADERDLRRRSVQGTQHRARCWQGSLLIACFWWERITLKRR
jgi:hypothetical protein